MHKAAHPSFKIRMEQKGITLIDMDQENREIIIPKAFHQSLQQALESCAFVFISAHTGWGKTSVVKALLETRSHTYVSLWDRDALKQASEDTTGMIVLDDFQAIYDYQGGEETVLELLRTLPPDTRCILLSRADIPEWLLPFIETGQMEHMQYNALALDMQELQELLERMEFFVPAPDVLKNVWDLTQGNPSLVLAIGMYLSEENPLSPEVISKAREMFFPFLDRQLFRYWDPMEKRLLLLTSFFDSFTVDMARVLTGNPDVEQVIERLRQTGSFLTWDKAAYRCRFPLMRRYLQARVSHVYRNEDDLRGIYDTLSLCCQLQGDYDAAVSYSIQAKNRPRTTELLTAYIRNHPKEGIRALRNARREIAEDDRESIPELLCGVSMIYSQDGLTEESERCLTKLEQAGNRVFSSGKTSRTARCFAAYALLHLPHRTNAQRVQALDWIVDGQEHGELYLPAFSITDGQPSVLRGLWDLSDCPMEEHPRFKSLMVRQYGRTAADILRLIGAERIYERGEYRWEHVTDLASILMDTQNAEQIGLTLATIALAARVVCTQADLPLAFSITSSIQDRLREDGPAGLLPYADALMCRVSLLGDCVYANAWYEERRQERLPAAAENRYLCLTMARCRIQHQEYMEAYDLLGSLLGPLRAQGRVLDVIEALLLSAICRRRMGIGEDTWWPLLAEAMEIAQPYGYTALFAELGAALLPLLREISWPEQPEYLDRLLQAARQQAQRYPGYLLPFNAGTAYHPSLPADLLDEQEKQVFRSICMRRTNQQVCESLGISGRQLTRLTNSLYAKLGTTSRKQIREMGVILIDKDENS